MAVEVVDGRAQVKAEVDDVTQGQTVAAIVLIDEAFEPTDGPEDRFRVSLVLTKTVVKLHGGRFEVQSVPSDVTYVQMRLPLRD